MKKGSIIEGRYELVRRIGVGGMGAVWEVLDLRSGQRRALKTIHEHYRDNKGAVHRFIREAKAAMEARRSAHVVEVIELSNLEDGRPYMILEYLEGENLLEVIKREKMLAPDRAARFIVQACEAVAEVHGQGIIHRDLKPGNLFLTSSNGQEWIKLLDFGIAKFREKQDDTTNSLTETGSALGTIRYMAPEQISDAKRVDHRSDVYSLGAILYRMLTGKPPRDGKNIGQLIQNMGSHVPPPPEVIRPGIDPGLGQVVMRCIDLDPSERYTSVMDLASALHPFCLPSLTDDETIPDEFSATVPDGLPPVLPREESADDLEATIETDRTSRSAPRRRKNPYVRTLNLFKVPASRRGDGPTTFELLPPSDPRRGAAERSAPAPISSAGTHARPGRR